jgi:hypothetical protein
MRLPGDNWNMQDCRKRLIFDTSGLNALADDRESLILAKALGEGFLVRLSETNISEVGANPKTERREKLLALCRRLVHAGECIIPYHAILVELAKAHSRNPASFRWESVPIRGRNIEAELTHPQYLGTDEAAQDILADFEANSATFEAVYRDARPAFDRIFKGKEKKRPTVSELIDMLKNRGAFWKLGMGGYKRACGKDISEDGFRAFIDACPPFNALLLSLCVAEFHRCIKHVRARSDFKAGRLDLFSSVYLPYCDRFITNDKGQRNSLALVAAEAGLITEVCSLAAFKQQWLVST